MWSRLGIKLSACDERWWTGVADERDCAACPSPPVDLGRLLLDALDSGGADARITAHTARDGHTFLAERQYLVEWCGSPVYHGTDLVEALSRLAERTRPPLSPPTLCALETA